MFSIVMMSCDKYKCLTHAFDSCMDKYYANHPKIYHIYGNDSWTKRLREELKTIPEEYILFLLDDMLLRKPVKENLIQNALNILKQYPNVAVINFERNYREAIPFSENWLRQKKNQMYLHSCQPSLLRKKALIENLQKDEDAWQWEMTYVNNEWDYLINKDIDIIDIGRTNNFNWGIVRGKISQEFLSFLEKEGLCDEIVNNYPIL